MTQKSNNERRIKMKFKKKPVTIDAIQWNGENTEEVSKFVGEALTIDTTDLKINTLEGTMTASVGDFIIKGVKGEFYPCKPDIFEQTYDAAQECEKILCVYVDKNTQKYTRYEVYPLSDTFTKEKLMEAVNKHNSNEEKTTIVKVYEDDLLVDFVEDTNYSVRIDNLRKDLHDICRDIETSVNSLESWTEDIEEFLKDKDGE